MGGVPGRSKGCNVCRRRKKGCDLRKPTCERCERDGYVCEGYQRSPTFITYQPKASESSKLQAVRTSPNARSPVHQHVDAVLKYAAGQSMEVRRLASPQVDPMPEYASGPPISFSPLPECFASSAFEIQILDQFFDVYLPKTGPSTASITTKASNWTGTIIAMSARSTLLSRTVSALGLCSLASRVGDEAMSRKGAGIYGAALMQLNKALQNPNTAAANDAIIPAIAMMSLYEQFNGFSTRNQRNQSRSWFAHTKGIGRLMQMRGPDGYSDENAFQTFITGQPSQFAAAFAARKATFLSSSEWRTKPWRNRSKTSTDLLYDILFLVPEILEKSENALGHDPPDLIEVGYVIEELLQVLKALNEWKSNWKSALLDGHIGTSSDKSPRELSYNGQATLPSYNMDILHPTMLFSAVNVNVAVVLETLTARFPPNMRSMWQAAIPDPFPHAMTILRCIPLCMRSGGIMGAQNVLFPMGALRRYRDFIVTEKPEVSTVLNNMIFNATKNMEYIPFLNGFLGDIQTIREVKPMANPEISEYEIPTSPEP